MREKVAYDRELAHAILDEALVCHVGFVVDGSPLVLPTIHARVGERLYVHGSTGTPLMRLAQAAGLDVCVTVTLLDGVVLARSQFESSMNYRCVIAHGVARPVLDPAERDVAFRAIVEHVSPGRSATSRPGTAKELAATGVLALDLDQVSIKVSTGDPEDDPADLDGPYWAGVIPVHTVFDEPVASADLRPGIERPAHLDDYGRP
jgi:nitroimidazol reductase NimA-like FMN-containing flavoprotein (pyridoxamine 5'-phosphate oxidase superfamily)